MITRSNLASKCEFMNLARTREIARELFSFQVSFLIIGLFRVVDPMVNRLWTVGYCRCVYSKVVFRSCKREKFAYQKAKISRLLQIVQIVNIYYCPYLHSPAFLPLKLPGNKNHLSLRVKIFMFSGNLYLLPR